jgi:TolB-like protein/Tfp pilus assembly protein PilF
VLSLPFIAFDSEDGLRYLFENYCLDTDRRELRLGTGLVRMEPQVFDLIEYVIRNRERLVTKDDLIASVWDGRIVSESALTTRINAARTAIGDSGDRQRLIKTVPRKGIRFVGAVREEAVSAGLGAEQSPPSVPDKPSIAVLPFANLSGDPGQDYFTDGIVEDIITGLSRFGWLFVIARNSSFTYKGRTVDVKQVGRELGVRYVLEGSLQKANQRVRISAQLIDASTGAHLSAERFDGNVSDIFDLQDQVTASVVCAIAPRLEKAEIARAKRKPTENLDAYDYYLRGMASVYLWTKESHSDALRLFTRAIEVDPEFAAAYAMAARCYNWRATNGWTSDHKTEAAASMRLAWRAVDLGKDDAIALCMAGFALARMSGELETGRALIDRALLLNPNLTHAYLSGGWVRVWLGEPDEAISRFAQAMRLSPVDPHTFNMQAGTATAHLIAGRYEEARVWAESAIRGQPVFGPALRVAVASLALTGRLQEAHTALGLLCDADPALRLSNLKNRAPFQADGLARLAEGLRLAGLPE